MEEILLSSFKSPLSWQLLVLTSVPSVSLQTPPTLLLGSSKLLGLVSPMSDFSCTSSFLTPMSPTLPAEGHKRQVQKELRILTLECFSPCYADFENEIFINHRGQRLESAVCEKLPHIRAREERWELIIWEVSMRRLLFRYFFLYLSDWNNFLNTAFFFLTTE